MSTSGRYTLEAYGLDTLIRPVGRVRLRYGDEQAVLREVHAAYPELDEGVWVLYDEDTDQEVLVLSPRA